MIRFARLCERRDGGSDQQCAFSEYGMEFDWFRKIYSELADKFDFAHRPKEIWIIYIV